MKKLFILILFFCFCKIGFAQYPVIATPIGNANTLSGANGGFRASLLNKTFTDTTSANLTPLDFYAGSQIFTTSDGALWVRNASATKWLQILSSGASSDTLAWKLGGNDISAIAGYGVLGTTSNDPFYFITNNLKRLGIPETGIVRSADPINKCLTFDTTTKLMYYTDCGSGGGGSGTISRIGTIDSLTKSADGAGIYGNSLFMQTADSSHPGLLTAAFWRKIDSLRNVYWYAIQKTGYLSTAYRPNDSTIYAKALLLSMPAEFTVTPSTTDTTGTWTVTWSGAAGGGPYWGLTGNSGTTPGTNFIGTTDAQDLMLKTNGVQRMNISSAGQFDFGLYGATNSSTKFTNQNLWSVDSAHQFRLRSFRASDSSMQLIESKAYGTSGLKRITISSQDTAMYSTYTLDHDHITNEVYTRNPTTLRTGFYQDAKQWSFAGPSTLAYTIMNIDTNYRVAIKRVAPDSTFSVGGSIYGTGPVRFSGLPTSGTYSKSIGVASDGTLFLKDTAAYSTFYNSNVGSGYRFVLPNTNNIKTFTATNGLTADSATTNQIGVVLGGAQTANTTIGAYGGTLYSTKFTNQNLWSVDSARQWRLRTWRAADSSQQIITTSSFGSSGVKRMTLSSQDSAALSSIIIDNNSISLNSFQRNNSSSATNNVTMDTTVWEYTNSIYGGRVSYYRDSFQLKPPSGILNIYSLRTSTDTTYKKPMTWDTRNGRWEYLTSWGNTGFGAGGSMTYPGAGIANSTGSAWGTSYTTTGSGTVLALAASPAFSGSPTAPTQSANDNSTKIATTAYADAASSKTLQQVFATQSNTAVMTGTNIIDASSNDFTISGAVGLELLSNASAGHVLLSTSIGNGNESQINVKRDTIKLMPHLGNLYIDTINHTPLLSTTMMVWDSTTGKVYHKPLPSSSGSLTVGTTTISSGTTTRMLYDNAGVLGEYTVTGSGTTAVLSTTPTFTTSIIAPLVIGSASADGTLTLEGNNAGASNTGTSANIILKTGNTPTQWMDILNNGMVRIGSAPNQTTNTWGMTVDQPSDAQSYTALALYANNHTAKMELGYQTIRTTGAMVIAPQATGLEVNSKMYVGAATSPTAYLHLIAGTTAASTAPLKFTSGTNMTTAEAGAMEWDGTNLFITQTSGPTRKTLAYTTDITGTVSSVAQSFTGGLISVSGSPVTTSGTLALTVAGTSGGIPYFSSASTWASSAALAANAIVIGGGAGASPSTTTTGTGILTFLGTPSSANLASALTDETGSGVAVFGTTPTFTTSIISPIVYGSSSASGSVQIGSTSNGTKGVITMLDSVNFNGKSIEGYTAKYNVQTGTSYTLVAADAGKIITISNASAITLTVPASLPAGFTCTVIQLGAGQITFTASSTTINNRQSYTKTAGQYAVATITQYTTNTFATAGDMQ